MKAYTRIFSKLTCRLVLLCCIMGAISLHEKASAEVTKDIHLHVDFAKPNSNGSDTICLHALFIGTEKSRLRFQDSVGVYIAYYNAFGMLITQYSKIFAVSDSEVEGIIPTSPFNIWVRQQGDFRKGILQKAPNDAAYAVYRYVCSCSLMQPGTAAPQFQKSLVSPWSPKIFLPPKPPSARERESLAAVLSVCLLG
ncbi:MAG TPA: hypothetical protein VKV29_06070 [Chthonomonas sp.]|jgi:hypothetical protein|uniref:hypothetical protein n=1 Tax=Chthonomonas sp. TaxID=2282153 RepID=UPI002B4AD316|nr:hypothetical protein [Chthonomonas sp.]HLH79834.1 hypothetical protein [Chthonomonas sp.]